MADVAFDLVRFMQEANWMDDANCKGLDPDIFFPARGEVTDEVKAICRECDVQAECLAYALNNGEHYGIWGGVSERQRRTMRRRHAANVRGPIPPPSELQHHEHGTNAGYVAHLRARTQPCPACKHAYAAYEFDRKAAAGPRKDDSWAARYRQRSVT